MHLAEAFIQRDLQCIQDIHYLLFVSMCVPWELNPQHLAQPIQCSTTEPQERFYFFNPQVCKTAKLQKAESLLRLFMKRDQFKCNFP